MVISREMTCILRFCCHCNRFCSPGELDRFLKSGLPISPEIPNQSSRMSRIWCDLVWFMLEYGIIAHHIGSSHQLLVIARRDNFKIGLIAGIGMTRSKLAVRTANQNCVFINNNNQCRKPPIFLMVSIPPIKVVMAGGWFMLALLYQHYKSDFLPQSALWKLATGPTGPTGPIAPLRNSSQITRGSFL